MTACRVAIADDAPDVRMLLRTILEEEGFTVVGEARNGAEAVELAHTEQPDVLLLDLSMPVMDGLEALPLVTDASPDTAVIVLSGFVNPGVQEKVTELGASACVEKGINLSGLVQTVRELCPAAQGEAGVGARRAAKPAASPSRPAPVAPRDELADDAPVLDADDLVPVLMHELNPAVTILRRSLAAAEKAIDGAKTADAREALGTAQRALSAVTGLLDAFAQVRAAETGQLHLQPETVALDEVVRVAVGDLRTVAGEREVTIRTDGSVRAHLDAGRLRQVLANLLSNAAKFAPPTHPIEVGVSAGNGNALVWVEDRGGGVPPEASETIFRKYARLGEAPGMGLGLYIARAIVRAHGGDLVVEHPAEGGARFVARFPIPG